MSDVARLAGVSAQTVSRVAAGSEHVRPDTRERVLRAMNQLGYSPNRAAQALRRGSFKTIGVLTQQIQRTGEALTTAGVLEAATAADYAVNLVQVEHPASNDLREAVYRLSHQAIDGLVVVQAGRAGREQLVLPPSMPVAVSDSTLVDYYPSASADQVGGVRDAVGHLLGLGHRTVHHVCGPEDSQSSLIRRATWARCLQEAGREVPEPVPGDWEAAAGYEAGLRLSADPEATAVFARFLGLLTRQQIILVPRRPDRTPSARQLAEVAGRQPFQAPACLTRCLRPERFVSISWDKQVNHCSYAGGKAPLRSLDHAGLLDALSRVMWQRCGS